MSIAYRLRRLFNIGVDEELDETPVDGETTLYGDDYDTTHAASSEPKADKGSDTDTLAIEPEMQTRIFDGVLSVFNASLPDFLQKSIDPDAQRRALARALDSSITQYLASLSERADRIAASRLRGAADQARAESEKLRSKMETVEIEKNRIREQQLSADRRRRALDDRVRDLESQIAKADADAEQLRLENQSLVNKLKVADIQPAVVEELNEQIRVLQAKLQEQGAPADTGALEAANARIADLEQGAELNKSMIGQLEERLAEECRLKEECKTRLDAAKKELAEAAKIAGVVEKLKSQIEGVQDVISKRDERIARLKSTNKKLKETIAQLETELHARKVAPAGLFALENEESIANVEDDFQCPEWFVSEPEPGMGRIKSDLDDFGYQEPPKKPKAPENDAQLSLF